MNPRRCRLRGRPAEPMSPDDARLIVATVLAAGVRFALADGRVVAFTGGRLTRREQAAVRRLVRDAGVD